VPPGRQPRPLHLAGFKLIAPPGPPDGYATYYTIVYGALDQTRRETSDMFVPDTLGVYGPCNVPGDPTSCPNLNGKITNLMTKPVYVSAPPTTNVEGVVVVPNPYKQSERWDQPGVGRVQFRKLPAVATVKVFTIAGDLVQVLEKTDPLTDSIDWNLKNGQGNDVTSGIYLFHVISREGYEQKGHFVIVR
jgi:hypothetical protein